MIISILPSTAPRIVAGIRRWLLWEWFELQAQPSWLLASAPIVC